jgi:ribosomal protein S8
MMTDPSDMLTAFVMGTTCKHEATFPYSKLKMKICEILVREGYFEKPKNEEKHPPLVTLNILVVRLL